MTTALALPRPGLSTWQRHLAALGLVAAAVLLLFHRDAVHMVSIWWTSSTFNHCLLIPPIIAWLVRQRLPALQRLEPAAWAPGLALAGLGAFAWLLGEAAGAAVARHFALVIMLQGAVVACLGKAVARALAFPIGYALFVVPFGGFLVPPLQTLTAEMAMALLGLAGVPAHIEGVFITTPVGWFEVAEACAGLQFLIAMAALGALAAHLCFRSWRRRAAFIAACLIVPVVANGLRAFGTILIAERFGIDFAAGFDHIVYGFVFFALVIALIFAAAWRWFDRDPAEGWFDPTALPSARPAPLGLVAGAVLAIATLPLAWSSVAAAPQPLPAAFELPQVPGWSKETAGAGWRPSFAGAGLYRIARYTDPSGRSVDLVVAAFAAQAEGAELAGFGQGEDERWAWTADAPAPPGGRAERVASHGLVRETLIFYRVGGVLTGSETGVKLATMRTRLLGGRQQAVAVMASGESRAAIDDFLAALGPVDRLADRAAGAD